MKIYTKGGDKGQTHLLGGSRVEKSHALIEAYGTVDEFNSFIGLTLACMDRDLIEISESDHNKAKQLQTEFESIQNELFLISSHLACESEDAAKNLNPLNGKFITSLENAIDRMNEELPELKSFILPGGSTASGYIHVARSVCRRAERRCVALGSGTHEKVTPILNRLSDYLFMTARYWNYLLNRPEKVWKQK